MNEAFADRLPPQNIEAEQAVLGAIFLEPSSLNSCFGDFNSRRFLSWSHQKSLMRCLS